MRGRSLGVSMRQCASGQFRQRRNDAGAARRACAGRRLRQNGHRGEAPRQCDGRPGGRDAPNSPRSNRAGSAWLQAERAAQAEAAARPERKVAMMRAPGRNEPITAIAPVGEPLPLVQMANTNAAIPPRAEGPVRSRLREFVSDVRRVPGWFASAKDWMAESVPLPRLPLMPGRQFRAEL